MNWGIFVVKTQPNKFFIFEREFSRQDGPTGKTRLLAIYSSYSVIQMRYPLHELIEMPGFFSELPFQDQGAEIERLRGALQLWADVIAAWDSGQSNPRALALLEKARDATRPALSPAALPPCPDCELPRLCNKHFAETVRPKENK